MQGRGNQYQVRFGPPHTPDVVKTLLLANVGVFIVQLLLPAVTDWFAAYQDVVAKHIKAAGSK